MAKKFKADSTAQPASISGSETPPTHGVGGGVLSRKPAARGGRSSVILGTPPIGTPKQSKLAAYLKRTAGKRVK